MRKYPFLFLMILIGFCAQAQKYQTAAGVRLGRDNFGISLQQKVMERTTLEGIFAIGNREASGTVLFERHFPLMGKGFNYYLGGGAHVGQLKDHGAFVGGDIILGTELKLPIFPLLLSFDVKPAIHANHENWFDFASGFTLRYILVKEKKEKKKFGIFGPKEKESSKKRRKFNIFGPKEEEKPKRKFNIFGPKEEEKPERKFNIFGPKEEEKPERKFNIFGPKEEGSGSRSKKRKKSSRFSW